MENRNVNKRIGRLFPIILLAAFLVITGLIIYIQHAASVYKRVPPVRFDPRRLIRVHEVSRVYKIGRDAAFPDYLFFACEEGLLVLSEKDYSWKRYGLEHGLPSESIHGLAFYKGKLFVGTSNGIACFNPAQDRFLPILSTQGLNILSMESLGSPGLYFYAEGKGLFIAANTAETFKPAVLPGFSVTGNITCLKAVGKKLFICQEGLGVAEFDSEKGKVQSYSFSKKLSKRTEFQDLLSRNGILWAATSDDGLWMKPADSDTLLPVDAFPAKGAYAFTDEKDGFWCGTPWGLWRYYDKGGAWMQFVHPEEKKPTDFQVFALFNDGDRLWYGSKDLGAGFLRKDRIQWQPLRAGLSKPNVAALAVIDSTVVVGYGYQGSFLDMFSARTLQYETPLAPEGGPADPNLQALAISGQRVYYGGFESFGFYDRDTKVMRYYGRESALPAVDIAQIMVSGSGALLCASLFGIVEYFPAQDSFATLAATRPYRITSILPMGDSLYFGTLTQGVRVFDRKSGLENAATPFVFASRIMGLAVLDVSGRRKFLFIATQNNGCFQLDIEEGKAVPLPVPDTLLMPNNERANDIMTMRKIGREIWVGTRNNGCLIYNPDAPGWKGLGYYDGLLSDQVRSLYDDSNYIWIGCYGGFHRLEKQYYSEQKR